MHISALSVRNAGSAVSMPQMSLPRVPKSDLVQLHKETWISRMISHALCFAMALLAIPGMVIGLVVLLGWAAHKGVNTLIGRVQGNAVTLGGADVAPEFPAMWEE